VNTRPPFRFLLFIRHVAPFNNRLLATGLTHKKLIGLCKFVINLIVTKNHIKLQEDKVRILLILLTILWNTLMFVDLFAQEMPLVFEVENTGTDCPIPYLPSFNELPDIQALPDPFEWTDGRGRISNFSDWRYRRAEISAEVQHYELGNKPLPPENLQANLVDDTLKVTIEEGGKSLTLHAIISLPDSGSGPFPAVIGVGFGTGSLPPDLFTSRSIATIQYIFWEVAPWTQEGRGQGGFYELYPDPKVGYFTAWAWGISRIIDGLEKTPQENIDLKHLAVTGCSFAGKIALFAGALDERIALTIAQEPGGGGDAAWRVTETLSGSRETLRSAQSYGWYYEDVSQFNNAVTKLPFDHHEVMAMIAPRALFVLGNPDYEWLADESGYVGCMATHEIWKALGVPDRFGFSKVGDHGHCELPDNQRPEVEAFVDKFLLDKDSVNTDISTHPGYTTNLASWITWTTPTLAIDTSFFGKTSLIYPSNLQTSLDTNITFLWNKVEDAEKYFFQVSIDPTFKNITKSDSTTDTVKTITGLLNGKRYYWRVQVLNTAGSSGPWSDHWNFVTFIPLPAMPQLVSATPVPNRSNNITLKWRTVEYADQYRIQISRLQTFSPLAIPSETTSDTVKTLSGLVEGQKYYWRIRAENIAGPGPWSDVPYFTIIVAPTDLLLQISALTEITLTWKDNSKVEDGYVIERKQSPQTSFTILDTLEESRNVYVDNNVEQGQTYTYRIKAYKDSAESDYSNEASLVLLGIKEEKEIPIEYAISQNYPNPFNPTTKIKFALPKTALTKIIIFDLLGREIRILVNKEVEAGYHEINIDANNLVSGIYYYRIQSGDFVHAKKMILMK
jgi:hypothetical protein